MAGKCKLSREAVNRNIKRLEEKGKLSIVHRKDEAMRTISNLYQLSMPSGGHVILNHTEPCDSESQSRVTLNHTNLHPESSVRETSEEREGPDGPTPLTIEDIIGGWNEVVVPLGLPKILGLSNERRVKLLARLREHSDFDWWQAIFNRISRSKFLQGDNPRGWVCTFDFLIKNDSNALKIYEGQYENAERSKSNGAALR